MKNGDGAGIVILTARDFGVVFGVSFVALWIDIE